MRCVDFGETRATASESEGAAQDSDDSRAEYRRYYCSSSDEDVWVVVTNSSTGDGKTCPPTATMTRTTFSEISRYGSGG